jgi:hypothetical protein
MTAPFSARRRADEFEALLSRDPRDPDTPLTERDAARFAALLDVVDDLRALPEVAPRAEFSASLRERLMAEADTVLVAQPAAPSRLAMPARSRNRQRLVAVVLGGATFVGATATVAVAAQGALPGESLYGVKRGIESAEIRFAPDDATRGRALLAQADNRLTELEQLTRGGGNAGLIPATLDAFTEQSGDGVRDLLSSYDASGSQQDAQHARDFTATSLARLDDLQDEIPTSARDQFLAAGRTLLDLDYEVGFACAACDGGITSVPEILLTSATQDLLTGLDPDAQTLEGAPIAGQDVTGIVVPEQLQHPQVAPTSVPTNLPTNLPTGTTPTNLPTDTTTTTTTPGPTGTDPTKPDPTKPVKDITKGLTDTTGTLTNTVDQVTGGALGGLTTGLDDATGGLIGDVTGTLDGATGGLLGSATGGLLPGTKK